MVLKVIRRPRATLIFAMGVPIVEYQWVPENRFPPARQTIPGGTDAIFCYVYGGHDGNVFHKYDRVMKVIRRSRATLIFSMGISIGKLLLFIVIRYYFIFYYFFYRYYYLFSSFHFHIYIYYYNN